MAENTFQELSKINVSEHVENKGRFSYLSWPFAISELSKFDDKASWEVKRFPMLAQPEIMVPYMETSLGFFVEVSVTVKGNTRSQIHPILDNNNKPIAKPSTFQINTSIQRALVKAIGLHGLGLYIYAGEDLPLDTPKPAYTEQQYADYMALVDAGDSLGLAAMLSTLEEEAKIGLHNGFEKGNKSKGKDKARELEKVGFATLDALAKFIDQQDAGGCAECLDGITDLGKRKLNVYLGNAKSKELGALLRAMHGETGQ